MRGGARAILDLLTVAIFSTILVHLSHLGPPTLFQPAMGLVHATWPMYLIAS